MTPLVIIKAFNLTNSTYLNHKMINEHFDLVLELLETINKIPFGKIQTNFTNC